MAERKDLYGALLAYSTAAGFKVPEPGEGRFPAPGFNRVLSPNERVLKNIRHTYTSLPTPNPELAEKEERIRRIREIGEKQRSKMQQMLDESLQRQKGGEAGARLQAAMERLEAARAAERGPTPIPEPTPATFDDPFAAAQRMAGEAPATRAPGRFSLSARGLGQGAIRAGSGLAQGAVVDWLARYLEGLRDQAAPRRLPQT